MKPVRLDKAIADQGLLSRREVRELIRRGVVRVNGDLVSSPEYPVAQEDCVTVEGQELIIRRFLYLMMNKPAGVLSATRDRNASTVVDLVPPSLRRKGLFPAGRLDKDTTGFVLLTDDGDFSHKILSPKSHIPKTYHVRFDCPMRPEMPGAFAAGLTLDGGDACLPASIRLLDPSEPTVAEIVIHQGLYHQIKRMAAQFSLGVVELRRVKMGELALDQSLKPGECREITAAERTLLLQKAPLIFE
ncbi:pseudouridine synthase [Oscillospiraceae bacterium MB08-C2-2]|nr:pseudouridine synthase [Oscillospiraceae bacterium MB08-C2-2]